MSARPTFLSRLSRLSRLIPSAWRGDSAPRVDAAPQLTDTGGGAIANPLSGMGGHLDKGAASRPNVRRRYLDDDELVAALRGTVYRRLVELLPQAATAKGYTLTEEDGEQNPLAKELRDLDVMGNFRAGDAWGRCLGESLVMMVVEERGNPPLSTPLDPSKVTKIHRLQIYDRNEFTPVSYITNPIDGELGSPELYSITPRRAGVTTAWQTVHASRFLRFYGDDLPPSRIGFRRSGRHRWGADAIGQVLWTAIGNQAATANAGAQLAQELSISVFTFKDTPGQGKKGADLIKRGRNLNRMKSIFSSFWLSPGDEYHRVAANPSGFRDLSEESRIYLQSLTGHPGELLFGIAPSGLNTDGKSWQVAWGSKVAAYQQDRYLRNLERLIEVVYYATTGSLPKSWAVTFNPLDQLTEMELADLRTKHTMADVDAIDRGILKEKEARTRYEDPTGFVLDLQVEDLPEEEVAETAPPRIGEINASIELGARLNKGELTPEQVRLIAVQQLKLSPEDAAKLSIPSEVSPEVSPEVSLDPANLDADKDTATGPGTKRGARIALFSAVRAGDITRPKKCPECGKGGQIEGHHADYDKPLEVEWMCSKCHTAHHARGDFGEPGKAVVWFPLSQQALDRHREMQEQASAIVGAPLDIDRPHMTALYLGAIDDEAAEELHATVADVARRHPHSRARVQGVDTFTSPEGTAIVLLLSAFDAERLESELSRAAMHLVTGKQAGRSFVPHITLGYVPRQLSAQEAASLRDLDVGSRTSPWSVSLSALEVTRNGAAVEYPLTGERNDAENQGVE